jgi:hypothetical protein
MLSTSHATGVQICVRADFEVDVSTNAMESDHPSRVINRARRAFRVVSQIATWL